MTSNRILRVFVRRTSYTPFDELAVVGEPGLFAPKDIDEVHVSCLFSWDREVASRLRAIWDDWSQDWAASAPVKLGGPGLPSGRVGDFVPGRYIRKGVTFSTRGCNFRCPWCMVDEIEGPFRLLGQVAPGNVIQDNNLLLASRPHLRKVFRMLKFQKGIRFSGGLDSRLLKPWHVEELRGLSIKELWFACDEERQVKPLTKAAQLLKDFPRNKKRCYMLAGFGKDTIEEAEERVKLAWDLGFIPFAQLYQPAESKSYSKAWKDWQRSRCRPAIMAKEWG